MTMGSMARVAVACALALGCSSSVKPPAAAPADGRTGQSSDAIAPDAMTAAPMPSDAMPPDTNPLDAMPSDAMPPVAVDDYPWLPAMAAAAPLPPLVRLDARFPSPAGFTRVAAAPGSYAAWLRGLPVRTDRAAVLAYDGRPLFRPSAAVVALDVGDRDLQQCADTVIRLHAEYLWHRGRAAEAAYHFTSGDRSAWKDWRRGERFKVAGSRVERVRGAARPDTWAAWRGWLAHTFRYAGTQSLRLDSDPVGARPLRAGDFLVQPGGPGHAVVLLDVAEHPDGRRAALIGQGFMPAEDLHVLQMPGALDDVWFLLPPPEGGSIMTPSWPRPFARDQARRFRGL